MASLDEFAEFDRERKEIDSVIEKTIKALQGLFDVKRGFPYEISLAKAKGEYEWPPAPSTSTVAMISGALAAAAGKGRNSILSRHVDWQPESTQRKKAENDQTLKVATDGLNLVLAEAAKRIANAEAYSFSSQTFGVDDVFTLSWLFDVHSAIGSVRSAKELEKIIGAIAKARNELTSGIPASVRKVMFRMLRKNSIEKLESEHAFPLLRVFQIKDWAGKWKQNSAIESALKVLADLQSVAWQEEFSRRVHEQLSFHAIPDSRFDPAELAFALEGLVLVSPSTLDRALVKRTFSVLLEEQKQKRNPTLRPARPIKSDPAGSTLFPVSVETFNSLLRTWAEVARLFEP